MDPMRLNITGLFIALKLLLGLGALLILGMMMLGRIGAGIGLVGLLAAVAIAFVSGSIEKRKLRAALAEIDAEFPSSRDR